VTVLAEILDGEGLQVAEWRRERFQTLGLDEAQAETLALSTADVHEFERLVAAGCPPATAFQIIA
jgi:hypothetical protein